MRKKKRKYRRKPKWQIEIAKERIARLFEFAKQCFKTHPERSKRYIQLMRRIALRYNVRLPKNLKRSFCKECNTLLIPGRTARVRTNKRSKSVIIKCLVCGSVYRYPYAKEKKR